ncbi:MAG: GAF domain-containing protein [Aeromicrobium sp.]
MTTEPANKPVDSQRRLRTLLEVGNDLTRRLELPVLLRRLVEVAVDLLDARYGALGVIGPDRRLEQFIHVGIEDDLADHIGHLPEGKGLLGVLIDDATPVRLDRLADDPRSSGFPHHHPPMDSFLGVPIRVGDEVFGNLYLTESKRGSFSNEDEELAVGLAATAGVAIENARLFEHRRQLELLDERTRIARDLHDHVIQRLFAVGLNLQATAGRLPTDAADAVGAQVVEIDGAIAQIRQSIFSLNVTGSAKDRVRARVLDVIDRFQGRVQQPISARFSGPVDLLADPGLTDDLVAVVTEGIANAVRHAHATKVSVAVMAIDGSIIADVDDDGDGPPEDVVLSGLANLRERAAARSGSLNLGPGERAGSRLRWRVPLT